MASAADYFALSALVHQASAALVALCKEIESAGVVRGSVRAAQQAVIRRTPGGGGRQRALLLNDVQVQTARLHSQAAGFLHGVADLWDSSVARDSEPNRPAESALLRSAMEHVGIARWLISDLRDSETPDASDLLGRFDGPIRDPKTKAESLRAYGEIAKLVSGSESCRRLLTWKFEQLRHDRNTVRSMPENQRFGSTWVDLFETERELIETVNTAGWEAVPARVVDGSETPAALVRENSSRPEKMPPLSDLAAIHGVGYALLSKNSHPSTSVIWNDSFSFETIRTWIFLTLSEVMPFIAWSGAWLDERLRPKCNLVLITAGRVDGVQLGSAPRPR